MSPFAEPSVAPVQTTAGPQKVDYMLDSWDSIASTTYKVHQLCLEHLRLDGETADDSRECLRLAPQPLQQSEIKQTVIQILLEHAFKIAAQMSNSGLFELARGTSPSVPGDRKKKLGNSKREADQNTSPSANHVGSD